LDKDAALSKIAPHTNLYEGKEMALLKLRDLSVLVNTKAVIIKRILLKPVMVDGKKKYEIQVDIQGDEGIEECLLITAKDDPQRWVSLNKAIDMLEEYTNEDVFEIVRYEPKN